VAKLIRFFTKGGETVLDPFLGSGSSAVASMNGGRHFVRIELYPEWLSIAKKRIANTDNLHSVNSEIYCGDSLKVMHRLAADSIDFVVTSPPYWSILREQDHKAKGERIAKGLATHYGDKKADLASIRDYTQFIEVMVKHFEEYHRLLCPKKYAAVIVSDFRHGQEYDMFHAHIVVALQRASFTIQGLIALVQDSKKLYPYGYPSAYVPNISNQFIVIGRKLPCMHFSIDWTMLHDLNNRLSRVSIYTVSSTKS
jgi:DNA modification methylase